MVRAEIWLNEDVCKNLWPQEPRHLGLGINSDLYMVGKSCLGAEIWLNEDVSINLCLQEHILSTMWLENIARSQMAASNTSHWLLNVEVSSCS